MGIVARGLVLGCMSDVLYHSSVGFLGLRLFNNRPLLCFGGRLCPLLGRVGYGTRRRGGKMRFFFMAGTAYVRSRRLSLFRSLRTDFRVSVSKCGRGRGSVGECFGASRNACSGIVRIVRRLTGGCSACVGLEVGCSGSALGRVRRIVGSVVSVSEEGVNVRVREI